MVKKVIIAIEVFIFAIAGMVGWFVLNNASSERNRYDGYPSFSGTVTEIEAWKYDFTDGSFGRTYGNTDSVVIGTESINSARIRVRGVSGDRWFLADNMTYVCDGAGDNCGNVTISTGKYVTFAYGTREGSGGDDYVYAVRKGGLISSAFLRYLGAFIVPCAVISVLSIVLINMVTAPSGEGKKRRGILTGALVLLILLTAGISISLFIYFRKEESAARTVRAHAPVIYLYGDGVSQINIRLDIKGDLTSTYPEYDAADGWNVSATPEGILTDDEGERYRFLFWEADLDMDKDLAEGYCVRGRDTEAFLDEALADLGLNGTEASDFKDFWLPLMTGNPYNVITFQTETYTDAAGLDVVPAPDVTVRINMMWYKSSEYVQIMPQDLGGMNPSVDERFGLTLVEWGGEMITPDD